MNGHVGAGGRARLAKLDVAPSPQDGAVRAREAAAAARDRAADDRDIEATRRDEAAKQRDIEEGRIERELERLGPGGAALAMKWRTQRARAAADRTRAAGDRERALRDRAAAALDGAEAARERERVIGELALSGLDELTWTTRRGPGLEELEREIERSQRTGQPLSVAYLDVDGLKALNDTSGHPAGDQLLMDVADALRTELRAYDLVVRMGGDEFLCVLSGADENFVRRRFAGIVKRLRESSAGASFSVGFAELEPGESGESLIRRADTELLSAQTGHDVRR